MTEWNYTWSKIKINVNGDNKAKEGEKTCIKCHICKIKMSLSSLNHTALSTEALSLFLANPLFLDKRGSPYRCFANRVPKGGIH